MEIHAISKTYGKVKALDSVSITLGEGIHGLLGENGAGKTTLMRIIATIIEPDSGTIEYQGISWKNTEKVRKMIGYLPQKFAMYKQLTVRESLRHISILKGIKEQCGNNIENVIRAVNLEDKANCKIGTLSGGMVRRLGIAQAILGNPTILIIDEPTAGLDPEERIRFRLLLRKLSIGRTIIFSTHIVNDVEAICDKLTILHKGNVIITGTPKKIKSIARGSVWNALVSHEKLLSIANEKFLTDQKKEGEYYNIRVLSDISPVNNSVLVDPTLEESYIWLTQNFINTNYLDNNI